MTSQFLSSKRMVVYIFVTIFMITIPVSFAQEYQELGVRVDTIAEDLEIPWSIAWTPDGIILFTERDGHLRVIHNDTLQKEPILTIDVESVEGGLLGIAIDPNYSENNYIYLYYTYNEFFTSANKVVRYIYSNGEINEDITVIKDIPGGPFHDGGRIKFGPDDKLYITTGDAGEPDISQDMNSLGGKILRINTDGTIPHDNPFLDSAIYSLGHRNVQGLDWDELGNLVITEHGPSGWMGFGHDEINLITPGANYGWPEIVGDDIQEWYNNPILHTGSETWAPSGAAFYDSEAIPQWMGKYFVATLRGNHLHMIDFDLKNNSVLSNQKLFEGEFGRLRDVAVGPDGNLYLLTSNQDGRGNPQTGDDKILKISPITPCDECITDTDTKCKTDMILSESNTSCDDSSENEIFVTDSISTQDSNIDDISNVDELGTSLDGKMSSLDQITDSVDQYANMVVIILALIIGIGIAVFIIRKKLTANRL